MEDFRNIIGFSKYQVSNLGNVKSFQSKNEKVLKTTINKKTGYVCLHLKDDNGMSKNITIHRLVAKAFIDNPENKKEVDHIDGNKTNNNINNLRWSTHSENNRNKPTQKNNNSGYSGITYMKSLKKWRVRIKVDKKEMYIGVYKNIEDAIKIRKEKEIEYFKEFLNEKIEPPKTEEQ